MPSLKVYFWFLVPKNFNLVLKKRKEIQKLRKISDRELMKGMTGVIDFQQIENPVLKYIANPFFAFYWWLIQKVIFW